MLHKIIQMNIIDCATCLAVHSILHFRCANQAKWLTYPEKAKRQHYIMRIPWRHEVMVISVVWGMSRFQTMILLPLGPFGGCSIWPFGLIYLIPPAARLASHTILWPKKKYLTQLFSFDQKKISHTKKCGKFVPYSFDEFVKFLKSYFILNIVFLFKVVNLN